MKGFAHVMCDSSCCGVFLHAPKSCKQQRDLSKGHATTVVECVFRTHSHEYSWAMDLLALVLRCDRKRERKRI